MLSFFKKAPRYLLLAPSLTLLIALCLLPLIRLSVQAFSSNEVALLAMSAFTTWWSDAYLLHRMAWTLTQALISCFLALALGLPMAWVLARYEFKGRRLCLRFLLLPFVTPTLVASMALLALWGPNGWLSYEPLRFLFEDTPTLLLLGHLFFNLGLIIRAGIQGLASVSENSMAAARTLGARPWAIFCSIEWPAMQKSLGAALCLVFIYCMSSFGLALTLASDRWTTIEVELYQLIAYELALDSASILSLSLMAISFIPIGLYLYFSASFFYPMASSPVVRKQAQGGMKCLIVLTQALWWTICGLPLIALSLQALDALIFRQAFDVLTQALPQQALWNSFSFTFYGLLLALLAGMTHAFVHPQNKGLRFLWRASSYLPLMISPIALAFGLLLLYPHWSATLVILISAYALLAYPLISHSIQNALIPLALKRHIETARTLGASERAVFFSITLPLIRPAIKKAMALATATMLGEFALSLFLSRPEWITLNTLIYQYLGKAGSSQADAAWVCAFVLMLCSLFLFSLLDSHADR